MFINLLKKKLFILFFFSFVCSYEVRLHPPEKIYTKENFVYLDLNASRETINEEFREYLQYGISITYSYFIELRENNLFFDTLIETLRIDKTAYYDRWEKKFVLEEIYPQKKITYFNSLEELTQKIIQLKKIKFVDKKKINFEKDYYFRTRLSAKVSQFKSYLHIVFSLFSLFKYKTTYLSSKPINGKALVELED